MGLHALPLEKIASELLWVKDGEYCSPECQTSYSGSHHECARRYFGIPHDNKEWYSYWCTCCTQYFEDTNILHYFKTNKDSTICVECQKGKCPRYPI